MFGKDLITIDKGSENILLESMSFERFLVKAGIVRVRNEAQVLDLVFLT